MMKLFDPRPCDLGEGPLWHPKRGQLFWFDITNAQLMSRIGDQALTWQFDDMVSAAGWVSETQLLIASATELMLFDLESGAKEHIAPLEPDNPMTRSNDGRADPFGGFWIGTMGRGAETGAGAIYRYYRGELRKLFDQITIPNAICFSPDGAHAYFTDTKDGRVMRQRLEPKHGWPTGEAELYLDLSGQGFGVDGAVIDAAGNFWNAQWGAGRVAAYDPDGSLIQTISLPSSHASCPSFGGEDLCTLFCTSALEGLDDVARQVAPQSGCTFETPLVTKGQAEHKIIM